MPKMSFFSSRKPQDKENAKENVVDELATDFIDDNFDDLQPLDAFADEDSAADGFAALLETSGDADASGFDDFADIFGDDSDYLAPENSQNDDFFAPSVPTMAQAESNDEQLGDFFLSVENDSENNGNSIFDLGDDSQPIDEGFFSNLVQGNNDEFSQDVFAQEPIVSPLNESVFDAKAVQASSHEIPFDIAVPENEPQDESSDEKSEDNEYVPQRKYAPVFAQPVPSALDELRSGAVKPASPISSIAATQIPVVVTAAEVAAAEIAAREEAEKLAIQAAKEEEEARLNAEQANVFETSLDDDLDFFGYQEPQNENEVNTEEEQADFGYEEFLPLEENNDEIEMPTSGNELFDFDNAPIIPPVLPIKKLQNDELPVDDDFGEFFADTTEQTQTSPEKNSESFEDFFSDDSDDETEEIKGDVEEATVDEFDFFNDFEENDNETNDVNLSFNDELPIANENDLNFGEQIEKAEELGLESEETNIFSGNENAEEIAHPFSGEDFVETDGFNHAEEFISDEVFNLIKDEVSNDNSANLFDESAFEQQDYQEHEGQAEDNQEEAIEPNPFESDEYLSEDDNSHNSNDYESYSDEEPKGKSKTPLIIAIIAVAVLVIGGLIFAFATGLLGGSSAQSSEQQVPSSSEVVSSEVVSEVVPEVVEPEPTVESIPRDEWYMLLVNRDNVLPESFTIDTTSVGSVQVDSRIAEALNQMIADGNATGLNLTVASGYRTYARQKTNYESQVSQQLASGKTQAEAEAAAALITAPPGASEHNSGLAVDIMATNYTTYDAAYANTPEAQWLLENAANYGFILRYPQSGESITKFTYEPWHYRYVGVDQAQKIKASGLTFEEYLAQDAPTGIPTT